MDDPRDLRAMESNMPPATVAAGPETPAPRTNFPITWLFSEADSGYEPPTASYSTVILLQHSYNNFVIKSEPRGLPKTVLKNAPFPLKFAIKILSHSSLQNSYH